MKPRYAIIKAPVNNAKFDALLKALHNVTSHYVIAGYIIIARYGVNKLAIRKILQNFLARRSR